MHLPATQTGTAPVTSFSDLGLQASTHAALARMDITTPTPIQARALPALLAGRDVIGQARTGSGKTLAFGIPAVERADPSLRKVQALVLTPTRELAVQVGGVLDEVGHDRGLITALIFGGRPIGPQIAMLRRGPAIVVGTPGRVLDLINQGALDLSHVRFLVLDEADEMLDRGFAPDVERILRRTPATRQTALFSATVPAWVDQTSKAYLTTPVRVMVDPDPEDAAPIEHIAFDIADGDKVAVLRQLLDSRGDGAIIVFGRTKHGVKKLAKRLEMDGYPVGALQGNLSQNARDRVMDDFRAGRIQILLATNVAARGLDISQVDLVINAELPESPELLTHRVGRTGRMGRRGLAVTLLAPEDGPKWRQLEHGLGRRIPRRAWHGADTMATPVSRVPDAAPLATIPAPRRPVAPPPAPERRVGTAPVSNGVGDRPSRPTPQWHQPALTHTFHVPAADQRAHHDIACSACGQPARVPFRPDPSRPVYCSDCFSSRPATGRRSSIVAGTPRDDGAAVAGRRARG